MLLTYVAPSARLHLVPSERTCFRQYQRGLVANVERAARALDAVRPGWASQIDLGRLDLGSCHACVLGQLFRPRWWQWREDGWSRGRRALSRVDPDLYDPVFACEVFREGWIAVIADRVIAASAAVRSHP